MASNFYLYANNTNINGEIKASGLTTDSNTLSLNSTTISTDYTSLKFNSNNFNDSKITSPEVKFSPSASYNKTALIDLLNKNVVANNVTVNLVSGFPDTVTFGGIEASYQLNLNTNFNAKIDAPVILPYFSVITPQNVDFAAHMTLGNLFVQTKECIISYGINHITQNATFVLDSTTGKLVLGIGTKIYTQVLKINDEVISETRPSLIVLSAHLVSGKTYCNLNEVIAAPKSLNTTEFEHDNISKRKASGCPSGVMKASYRDMRTASLATPQSCEHSIDETHILGVCSYDAVKKCPNGMTKSMLFSTNGPAQLAASSFTQQEESDPSSSIDLGTVHGKINKVNTTNSLVRGRFFLDANSSTEIINILFPLSNILEIGLVCIHSDPACQGSDGHYARLLKSAWQNQHDISPNKLTSFSDTVSDGRYYEVYKHLANVLEIYQGSGNFTEVYITPEGKILPKPTDSETVQYALTASSNGLVKVDETRIAKLNDLTKQYGQVATLTYKREVTKEDQISLPNLSQNHLDRVYKLSPNDPNYVWVDKMFRKYECEYSLEKLISELGQNSTAVDKLICPESCTTSMVEDALFRATGAMNLEDLNSALKYFFEEQNASYTQKKCYQMELLIKQAIAYANLYNFTLGQAVPDDVIDKIASPFVWVMNILIEKDGKQIPTAIPVVYLPKKLLAESSAHQTGSVIKFLGMGADAVVGSLINLGGTFEFSQGIYNIYNLLSSGSTKPVDDGIVTINSKEENNIISVTRIDATGSSVSTTLLTRAELGGNGTLILNGKTNTLVGVDINGKVQLNATMENIIEPAQIFTAYYAQGEWGFVKMASIKHLLSTLKGQLIIHSGGRNFIIGLDGTNAEQLTVTSKEGDLIAVAVDEEFFSQLSISKKKGIFKKETTATSHSHYRNEFKGNQFGSSNAPMQLFRLHSDATGTVVGFVLHAYKWEFISEDKIEIRAALAMNSEESYQQVTKEGFLGFRDGGLKVFENQEHLLQQGYTVVKRSEFHKYGIDNCVFNATNGIDGCGAVFNDYANKGNVTFISKNGSVDLAGKQVSHSFSYERLSKTTANIGFKLNFDQATVHAEWKEQTTTKYTKITEEIPTSFNGKNFNVEAKEAFKFKGNGIYVNLDIKAQTVDFMPTYTTIEEAVTELTKKAMLDYGFYNNFATAYHKYVAASETEEDISKTAAYGDSAFWLAKAILKPFALDLKFHASWQQGKLTLKEVYATPSTLRSTGNTKINGTTVTIEGLAATGMSWTINAHEFIMKHAFSSFEKKIESKGVNGEISFMDTQTVGAGINFSKLTESGVIPTSLFIKLSGTFELNAQNAEIHGQIEAGKLILKLDKLLLKSVHRIMKREGYSGHFSARVGYNPYNFTPPSFEFGAEVKRGDSAWVDQLASLVGTENVSILVKEMLHIQGGLIAQAKRGENGTLQDGGNLEIKAYEILTESLFSYVYKHEIGGSVGIDFASPKLIDRIGVVFGLTDKEKETFATIGRGNIEATIHNIANRDVNNLESESGFEIDPIRGIYVAEFFDTISAAASKIQNTFNNYFYSDTSNNQEPKVTIWDIIDYDASEDEAIDDILFGEKVPPSEITEDLKIKQRVFDQYVNLLVENGVDRIEAKQKVADLILENELAASKKVDVASATLVFNAAVFITEVALASIVGQQLIKEYVHLREALSDKIREIKYYANEDSTFLKEQSGKCVANSKQPAKTSSAGMPDPDQEPDDGDDRKKNVNKAESKVWKELKHYRGKTKTNGLRGKDQKFYEWDYLHNEIELYDRNGNPIDAIDPQSGERLFKDVSKHKKLKL